jgi:hypothetical protein
VTQRVLIEQRLRTRGLVGFLLGVLVIFLVTAVSFMANATGSISTTAYVIVVVISLVLAIPTFLFWRIDVRVVEGPTGHALEVAYGPGGAVVQRFGPDKLIAASANSFTFLQMGGWGYRGSLRLLRRAALATRRGDALDVQLQGKRRFIVTVDQPEDFVRALALPS